MSFYWLYDLPNWLFGTAVVGFFVLFGISGVFVTRKWVRRLHKIDHSHNDIVGYFLSAITVFYGITLGLVAVGTWNTYSIAQGRVAAEAQTIASLYRVVGSYAEPLRSELQKDLKDYTSHVIGGDWPLEKEGIIPTESGKFLEIFQDHLMAARPTTMSQQIIQAELFKQFNVLVEIRRARLDMVTTGLPTILWTLVILGGIISIIVTMFFDTKSFGMHVWMTGLLSALLGLLIFLIGSLDNPFRGEIGVGSDSLQLVYSQIMGHPAPAEPKTLPRKHKK